MSDEPPDQRNCPILCLHTAALRAFAIRYIPHHRTAIGGSGRPAITGEILLSRIFMATDTLEHAESLLAALSLDDGYRPQELRCE